MKQLKRSLKDFKMKELKQKKTGGRLMLLKCGGDYWYHCGSRSVLICMRLKARRLMILNSKPKKTVRE